MLLTPVPVISLLAFLIHLCRSPPACTYVCSVLLRLEKQIREEGAGAVRSPGNDGVWPEGTEEWQGGNQTLTLHNGSVGFLCGCGRRIVELEPHHLSVEPLIRMITGLPCTPPPALEPFLKAFLA